MADIWAFRKIQSRSLVPKLVPVLDLGVISLNSEFQSWISSTGLDMDIKKVKMATIGKPAQPNLLRLVSKLVPVIDLGDIDIWKSKMAAIDKAAKSNLLFLA